MASSPSRVAVAQVEQGLRRTVLIGQATGCGIAVTKLAGGSSSGYPTWFVWTVIVLLVSTTICTYALPAPGRHTALQLHVLICGAAIVSQIWVWDPTVASFTVPPLDNVLGIGMGLAALAFRWRIATVVLMTSGASYLMILPRTLGTLDAIGFVSVTWLAGAACIAARDVIDQGISDLARVEDQLQATTDLRESLHRRRMLLVKWRDVLHGKIIGSLLVAQRTPSGGNDEQVKALAREALAAITGIAPIASSFQESLRRLTYANNLEITATIEGDWSADGPRAAFQSAVAEALANVARHSGQRGATVTARFTYERWHVSISDPGVGFEPTMSDESRGLRVSLANPITTVGGTYEIRSLAGEGTTVTLSWERLSSVAAATTPTGARWLVVIAFASFLVHLMIGWQLRQLTDNSIALAVGGAVMLVLLGLAVVRVDPAALVVVMIAVQLLLAVNVLLPPQDGWVFWFAGALCGFSGVLAYRGSIGWSATVVILSWLGVTTIITLGSQQPLGTLSLELFGFYAGPLAATVFGVIGWIITLSHRALLFQAGERESALRDAEEVSRSTKQWLDEHGPLIARVSPLLERLGLGQGLSHQLQEDCRVMEAECRDHLEVPALITSQIALALQRARRSGVTIRLSVQPQASESSLQTQRELLLVALSVQSLTSLALTPSPEGVSLLIRAGKADIPLERLEGIAPLADVVPLADGILARLQVTA